MHTHDKSSYEAYYEVEGTEAPFDVTDADRIIDAEAAELKSLRVRLDELCPDRGLNSEDIKCLRILAYGNDDTPGDGLRSVLEDMSSREDLKSLIHDLNKVVTIEGGRALRDGVLMAWGRVVHGDESVPASAETNDLLTAYSERANEIHASKREEQAHDQYQCQAECTYKVHSSVWQEQEVICTPTSRRAYDAPQDLNMADQPRQGRRRRGSGFDIPHLRLPLLDQRNRAVHDKEGKVIYEKDVCELMGTYKLEIYFTVPSMSYADGGPCYFLDEYPFCDPHNLLHDVVAKAVKDHMAAQDALTKGVGDPKQAERFKAIADAWASLWEDYKTKANWEPESFDELWVPKCDLRRNVQKGQSPWFEVVHPTEGKVNKKLCHTRKSVLELPGEAPVPITMFSPFTWRDMSDKAQEKSRQLSKLCAEVRKLQSEQRAAHRRPEKLFGRRIDSKDLPQRSKTDNNGGFGEHPFGSYGA